MKSKRTERVSFEGIDCFICRTGNTAADRMFASQVESEVKDFLNPISLTVDELLSRVSPLMIVPGPLFIIVSPSLILDPPRCAAISKIVSINCRQTFMPHCCICRGVTVAAASNCQDLLQIRENLMFYEEAELSELVKALKHHVTAVMWTQMPEMPTITGAIKFFFGVMCLAFYALVLVRLCRWTVWAALVLILILWQGWHFKLGVALAVYCAFGAGFTSLFIHPTDIWPWLGRRWKFPVQPRIKSNPQFVIPAGFVFGLGVIFAFSLPNMSNQASGLLIGASVIAQIALDFRLRLKFEKNSVYSSVATKELQQLGSSQSSVANCRLEDLQKVAVFSVLLCYFTMFSTAVFVALRFVPAILFAKLGSASDVWMVLTSAALGLLVPTFLRPFARHAFTVGTSGFGLTEGFSEKLKRASLPPANEFKIPQPAFCKADFEQFAPDERTQVSYWLELLRFRPDSRPIRHWRAQEDYVFISYLWRDNSELDAASSVTNALATAGIKCFIDQMSIGREAGWYRMPLSKEICKCTHFFLVVSANISKGRVIMKEIELAMSRWSFEMLPTIICVVEPEVAKRLCDDRSTPLAVRFLLTFCPNLTFAEAAKAGLVRWIVEFSRREGMVNDWLHLLSPASSFATKIRLPGIAEAGLPHEPNYPR